MLKQNLQLKLGQKLAPQQIQLMKLIQLHTLEFEEELERELEENPALEKVTDDKEEDYDNLGNDYEDEGTESIETDFNVDEYLYDDEPSYKTASSNYSPDDEEFDNESLLTEGQTIYEYLLEQIRLSNISDEELKIAEYLIGNLDNDGYLRRDLKSIVDDLAFSQGIYTDIPKLEYILENYIQKLEPAGVGARNLQECLLLQIEKKVSDNPNVGLFKLDIKDYKGWAYGLKKAGYATNPRYAQILINRIEKYRLHEFDNIKPHEVPAKLKELYPEYKSENQEIKSQEPVKEKFTKEEVRTDPVLNEEKPKEPVVQKQETKPETEISKPEVESGKKKEPELHKYEEGRLTEEAVLHSLNERNHPNSNLKYVVLGGDISLSALAKKYNLRVSDLKDYNDLKTSDLKKNQIVFLEPKKSYGSQETHTVRKGEKMYDISQKYGIKLKHLYLKNRMEEGQEPKEGQVLYLQNKKPRRER